MFAQQTNNEHLLKKQSQLAGSQKLSQRMGTEPDRLNVAGYGGTHGSSLGTLAVQAGGKVNTGLMSHVLPVSEL